MTKSVGEIFSELAEQCVTSGANWAKTSSSPVNGYNIDLDLRLPIQEARQALWELVKGALPERDSNKSYEYIQAITDTLASLEKLFIEREKE